MFLLDGEPSLTAIFLLMFLSIAFLVIGIIQIWRAAKLPGWRGLLHPMQMGLTIWAAALGEAFFWLAPAIGLAALVLMHITRREDPPMSWFATLSGMLTCGVCLLPLLAP